MDRHPSPPPLLVLQTLCKTLARAYKWPHINNSVTSLDHNDWSKRQIVYTCSNSSSCKTLQGTRLSLEYRVPYWKVNCKHREWFSTKSACWIQTYREINVDMLICQKRTSMWSTVSSRTSLMHGLVSLYTVKFTAFLNASSCKDMIEKTCFIIAIRAPWRRTILWFAPSVSGDRSDCCIEFNCSAQLWFVDGIIWLSDQLKFLLASFCYSKSQLWLHFWLMRHLFQKSMRMLRRTMAVVILTVTKILGSIDSDHQMLSLHDIFNKSYFTCIVLVTSHLCCSDRGELPAFFGDGDSIRNSVNWQIQTARAILNRGCLCAEIGTPAVQYCVFHDWRWSTI